MPATKIYKKVRLNRCGINTVYAVSVCGG